MELGAEDLKRRRRLDRQSGQAVLMGVLALLLLMVSVAAGLNYIGPRATLGEHQAGPYQFGIVQKALRAFAAKNGRLPCPADGTIAQGSANEGLEEFNGSGAAATCKITGSTGVVPWQSIGLTRTDALDGYQSRIGYAVTAVESAPSQTQKTNFLNPPTHGWNGVDALQVETCTTNCGAASEYAYVLISYGHDRAGAYLLSGSRISAPASGTDEYANAIDSAFTGGPGNTAFEIWPYRTDSAAGTSYFDDVIGFETGNQVDCDIGIAVESQCKLAGGGGNTESAPGNTGNDYGSSTGSAAQNNNPNAPAYAAQNSDAGAQAASTGTINNTYSCGSGSTYCPGSTNAGSLANTYAYSGCSGNSCTATSSGECLNLVGNLGTVCVHDPVYGTGIFVGNGGQNGDWVGPNHGDSCPQCSVPGTVNYMIPNQTLTYDLASSYKSWAFVDYLVDGGMQVQVDGYQAGAWSITGDVSVGSTTINNVSPTTDLAIGQSIVNVSYFSNYTVITGINGNQLTVSQPATGTATGASLIAMDSGFNFSGYVTAGSAEIDNIALPTISSTNQTQTNGPYSISTLMNALAVGDTITGSGIPVGTVITAVSSSGLSVTISNAAFVTESPTNLFATPWIKIGTSILSNGSDTNVLSGTQISGIITSGSLSMTNVAPAASLAAGQLIAGPGISPGTIIESITTGASGTVLTLSQAATTSNTGYFLVATNDLITSPVTGDLTSGSDTIENVSSTVGITSGQTISGDGIPSGTTVTGVTGTTLTMSQSANATGSTVRLFFTTRVPVTGITGDFTSGSSLIANVSDTSGIVVNDHIDSPALPSGAYVTGIASSTSLSMSVNATASQTGAQLSVEPLSPGVVLTGNLTSGSTSITNVSSTSGLLAGEVIAASGLPSGTYITNIVSSTQLSVSQAATATTTGVTLVIIKGTPIIATIGNVTDGSESVTSVSPTTGLSTGEFVTNVNLQDGTAITAVASSALSISQVAIGTQQAAALAAGNRPQVTSIFMTATLTSGSTSVTNMPASVQPGLGASVWGLGIPAGTVSTALSGTTMTLSQSATLSQTSSIHFNYSMCPGPQTSSGGLYGAPNDERGATTQIAPIVQHPSAAVAASIPSQIWPQPGTAGSGTNSANSNPNSLSGNYIDQRDNQFSSLQFTDQFGNPIKFNVLVLQVLPYIYANGQSCTISGGVNTCDYGMLFEGAKGCYTDVYSARCTMQGVDEWWNPPVQVTMDCGQYGQ